MTAVFCLRSENGGISWVRNKPLVNPDVDRLLDFSTVVQNGSHVLIAGSPASVIFRSEDSGQTWTAVSTGMHGTVSRLMFVNAETILGVGDFGSIIRSSDSGRTWEIVRSAGFRAGVMSLVTTAERQPWDVLASVSADEGIRSVSLQLSAEQAPGAVNERMIAGEAAQEIISGLGATLSYPTGCSPE